MSVSTVPSSAIPRPVKVAALTVGVFALAFGAFAISRAQDNGDEITICVANNGAVRVVQSDSDCRPNEAAQTINKEGPAGPPGAPGQPGPQGEPGTVTVNVNEGGDVYSGPAHIFLEDPSDPDLGESVVAGFEGAVEIRSWSWGIENNVNIGSIGSGGGAGKAEFQTMQLSKPVDRATPLLMKAVATGTHFDELVLTGVAPGEAGTTVRYVVTMDLVVVSAVELDAESGDPLPHELVKLQFGAVTVDYFEIGPDGKPSPTPRSSFSWNRVTNSTP